MADAKVAPRSILIGAVLATVISLGGYFEGHRLTAYQDTGKVWTICNGHTQGVNEGDIATDAQCQAWLAKEMSQSLATVQRCITTPLNIGQLAAFTDATYNAGPAIVCGSTLQKKANAGDLTGACNELPRWIYASGKQLPGLVIRRETERKLCMGEPI